MGLFFLIWIWVLLVIVSFDLDFISFRHEILVLFGSICDWLRLGCIIWFGLTLLYLCFHFYTYSYPRFACICFVIHYLVHMLFYLFWYPHKILLYVSFLFVSLSPVYLFIYSFRILFFYLMLCFTTCRVHFFNEILFQKLLLILLKYMKILFWNKYLTFSNKWIFFS